MNNNGTQLATVNMDSGEIIEADVVPQFAITLDESRKRVQELQAFVREQMIDGEDYGIIPGTQKPTLYKPGAEKLNAIFGLAPIVEILDKTVDFEKGFIAYEVKVSLLNKRTRDVEAEGVGSCNSKERRYARQSAADLANTILKMAKKRALVDATLSATRASGLFTQDLEDMDVPHDTPQRAQQPRQNGPQGRTAPQNGHSNGNAPQEPLVPFGKRKDEPFSSLPDSDLQWFQEYLLSKISPDSGKYDARYLQDNQALYDHVNHLLLDREESRRPTQAAR